MIYCRNLPELLNLTLNCSALGTCKVYGDPHYTTFDGEGFLYQGDCTYSMMKTNDFEVQVHNQDHGVASVTE